MSLAPKLWGRSPSAISCGEGDICSLGRFSSAMQKRKNVSEVLSAFIWTDDDVDMDRQLIELVRNLARENFFAFNHKLKHIFICSNGYAYPDRLFTHLQ